MHNIFGYLFFYIKNIENNNNIIIIYYLNDVQEF